ncbi:peptidase MA superfamily protein [Burkholderia humptydooensis]|uniref:eCIS core domain-containing protein n=1 Tax=Burkholderia sp. 2002721687 TaxID=1468409 RepID=UPI0005D81AAA|nr:DUF4157 domain-containing protein [Burkholderia sp. 2002721687]AJY40301.1 peptidase MA superfamily protein [Burkholderia sp. 2002721687]
MNFDLRRRQPPASDTTTARAPDRQTRPDMRPAARGEPLPAPLRDTFEPQFGVDFSSVRLHTDDRAGASAVALRARAYSLGRDIVFAPGRFAPYTADGRALLAHELAHVAQDGARDAPRDAPARIDAPDSPQEREAEHAARAVAATPVRAAHRDTRGAASPRVSQAGPRHGPPTLHRSLAGAGIGGGSAHSRRRRPRPARRLLGPAGAIAGAVIGGIGGLVAGAVVGDLASRRSRGLTAAEKTDLREIFHDAVDYDKVTITRGSALSAGAARTVGNTINLQDEHFRGDTMELSDNGQLTLAHEMGHVWQYQNGGLAYIPSSLIPQIVAGLSGRSRNAAYDWRSAVRNHIDWSDWNAEQQAECISDYNEALRRINAGSATLADYETVTLAEPFIALVRERIGAPGSARRRREAPQAGAGASP